MNRTVGTQVSYQELAKRRIARWVVDDFCAEDDVELDVERRAREVDLDKVNALEAASARARSSKLEGGALTIDQPDLGAESRRRQARQAEAAAEVENAPPP